MTQSMDIPYPPEILEFQDKVLPVIMELVTETNFSVARGNPISRGMNLAMGHPPKTKAEASFQEQALRRIWQRWPGSLYPIKCPPPRLQKQVH